MALASLEPPRFGEDDAEEWTDARNHQSPNLWWPEDRAWFVATEVDFAWTYVGGSEETIDVILDAEDLEALVVELSDKPFADSDLLNATLDSA